MEEFKEKLHDILLCILFVICFPILWLMEKEQTKKGQFILTIVQIVLCVITTIIMRTYFLK